MHFFICENLDFLSSSHVHNLYVLPVYFPGVQTFFPYTDAACQTNQWKPKEAHLEDSCDELGKPDASREDPRAKHDKDYVPSEEYQERCA